ncbi:MAG: AAA family ATPase [Puia sp.]
MGPESTGKSTLSEQLADHFKTEWVPEFARNYLLEIRRPYTYEDLLYIAEAQVEQEDRICASTKAPLVFHRYRHVCDESLVRICF